MSESGSSFQKWLGGIMATVITGLLLWWLTGPLSPFVHKNTTTEQTKENTTSSEPKEGNTPSKKPEENKGNDPVPQEKIIVEASPNPYTITAGDQSQINVLAYTSNRKPVENASVEVRAGGGFFSISNNYVEIGTTNSSGVFKTYWKAPDPVAAGYGMSVTVSKDGYITGKGELNVITKNH